MIEINYIGILISSVVVFVLGALWYSPLLFGKIYMKIMGHENLPKSEIEKMQKEMMPYYGLQLIMTLITTFVFASNLAYMAGTPTGGSQYFFAFFMWLGYIVPTQVACVIWGATQKKFWGKQIVIMISYQFIAIMLTAFILTNF